MQLNAQVIYDFKSKTATNSKDCTLMLDIYRTNLYSVYKQEFVFVVNHFKVGNNYAWLRADLQRKDGMPIQFPNDEGEWDCCHVEALFLKSNDKWLMVENGEFSTDVWYWGISKRYPNAPKGIFDEAALQ